MKIVAVPATDSRNGLNRQLIGYATRLLEDGLVPDTPMVDPLMSFQQRPPAGPPRGPSVVGFLSNPVLRTV